VSFIKLASKDLDNYEFMVYYTAYFIFSLSDSISVVFLSYKNLYYYLNFNQHQFNLYSI